MPALLVSVRDAAEAAAALEGGAALIDVKDPDNGALGRAADGVQRAVIAAVARRVPVSAALGELLDAAAEDVAGLTFAKYGLAGCANVDWRPALASARERIERGDCRLVFVAYADWRRAGAPPPDDVFRFAIERGAPVLLDTWGKDGSTLLDWMNVGDATRLCVAAKGDGVRVALAGSLGVEQIAALAEARPTWFAVRGAACVGGRAGRIDAARVRRLAAVAGQAG